MTQVPFVHHPVMVAEVTALLAAGPPGWYIDGTVGGGGHARAVLEARSDISVLGIDRDPAALAAAGDNLAGFGGRVALRRARFDELADLVSGLDQPVGGVLFDLGVSSPQLDRPDRGFSYRVEGPLDMRMDPDGPVTAHDVVNGWDVDALAALFAEHGEGRFARRIAHRLVAARPVDTTTQLADIVRAALPAATRRTGGHPAKRVFQALRVAVNDELAVLPRALDVAIDALAPGGRCVVLAYHSGEDRIVKERFRSAETGDCTCPARLPCACGAADRVQGRLVFRGSRRPTPDELTRNPRADSARLRAWEKAPSPRPGPGATAPPSDRRRPRGDRR